VVVEAGGTAEPPQAGVVEAAVIYRKQRQKPRKTPAKLLKKKQKIFS
jgi:hypothetical protein